LAWAESGAGPIVVNAANWLTHLEYEWESPVWKHWIQFFSAQNRFVRYGERGCGMSDWQVDTLSLDQWTADLESIIDAARPVGPVTLLGISQGAAACIRFAIQHPERVAGLILYGGLRARRIQTWYARIRVCAPRHDRAGPRCVGTRQSDVPAGLHIAVHWKPRAAGMVQRALPKVGGW
jgi:pimeloyl-ACP methyl ester carboxylesterase